MQEASGNGLITNRASMPLTGRVSFLQTGKGGGAAEQNELYLFDRVGNLIGRQNGNAGLTEDFYYDSLPGFQLPTNGLPSE